ncbi:hypothetical protein [Acinetobacter soli]|uniref:hypothetical protein n=1 Tax=Acinetobacter soli TaxID=487316 RepID=UPI00125F403C|nr:hypothetical protein [Acinetobacter soli]
MNAHEYVAKHGVEGTKECLPSYIKHYCGLERIFIDELKQVVESVEIVEVQGGYEGLKQKINEGDVDWRNIPKLRKAIADYELVESYKQVKCEVSFGIALQSNQSIGAKCEVLDMVDVSPRCEVRNG